MAHSMTAYTSQNVQLRGAIARWEIRSVNHRYLELSFKLPSLLNELEYHLRDIIRKHLGRGKIDCSLKLDRMEEGRSELILDFNLINQLITASEEITKRFSLAKNLSVFDVLKWPSVVQVSEEDLSNLNESLLQSFLLVLQDFIEARAREGLKLTACLQDRLTKMYHHMEEIKRRLPEIQESYRLKFHEKCSILKLDFDNERLEQAMIHLIQKMDISEELDRLMAHLSEIERVLMEDKIVGRRLDFLMQELNRETNTLASKTIDNTTVQHSIALKVLIEEMREQIQNLE